MNTDWFFCKAFIAYSECSCEGKQISIKSKVGHSKNSFPILTTTGQKGGITFIDGYKLNLDQTEVTMKTLITHLYAMPEQESLIHALENGMKIKYKSNEGLGDESKQKILIDKKSWWEEASTEIDLQPIMKALFLQQKFSIRYSQSDGTQTDRIIAPYGLVLKYTTWYLVAFCYSRNEIRTFKCSRINYTGFLKEIYEIPDDFVLKNYWDLSTKAFIESRKKVSTIRLRLRFMKCFGQYLSTMILLG